MATSVVYRLKGPISDKCAGQMHKRFVWTFNLEDPDVTCLAMLGCHDLDGFYDPVLGKEIFDFNVTVNRLEVDPTGRRMAASKGDQVVDSFKITKDGAQKFYNLTSKDKL
jgi:hypothetical protein